MQLTPEQINEFVAKSVLDSQLGEAVKNATDKVLKDLQRSYDNPFEAVVRQHVSGLIDKYVRDTLAPQLETKVREACATVITQELVQKIVEAGVSKLNSRY